MNKKYVVRLTAQEREQIEKLLRRGRAHARKLLYGRILLKANADGPDPWTDERIADALEVSTATVARERRPTRSDWYATTSQPTHRRPSMRAFHRNSPVA